MESYKRWIRRNKDYVHSLESLVNGLTWLLPERFSESEIGPEAVTSILGIVTSVNEHIINTSPTQTHPVSAGPSSFPYSLCITVLKDIETLVEVAGQHFYCEDKKWNFIAVTEATKVLVRLGLLQNSGYKMLLHGGETVNVEKGSIALNPRRGYGWPDGQNLARRGYGRPDGQNLSDLEGRAMSALSRFGENGRAVNEPSWLRRVYHQHAIMDPPNVVVERPTLTSFLSKKDIPGGLIVIGEVMFIIRPLIYVLLIRKYGTRSWFPWFVSLAVDFMGMSILSHVTISRRSKQGQIFRLSDLEKHEEMIIAGYTNWSSPPLSTVPYNDLKFASWGSGGNHLPSTVPYQVSEIAPDGLTKLNRRKLLWALYLMRDPFFSKYTRKRLESTEKLLEPVPIVGFLSAKLIELIVGAQTRYTYMSGS